MCIRDRGADVHIHRPTLHRDVGAPHHLQDGLASDDEIRIFQQQPEQAVLFVGQLYRRAADGDAVAGVVEKDLPEAVDVGPVSYTHLAEKELKTLCEDTIRRCWTLGLDVSGLGAYQALRDGDLGLTTKNVCPNLRADVRLMQF